MRYFLPDLYAKSVVEISPNLLCILGIKTVLIDLDNTLTPTGSWDIRDDVKMWLEQLKANGFNIYIVSNEVRSQRLTHIAEALGVLYIAPAWKPRSSFVKRMLEKHGIGIKQTVMIGDQLFTDIFMAKRIGMFTILVEPMTNLNFITTKVLRCFERPLIKWMHTKNILRRCA
ncbi:MAG: hypothetical protein RUDDFDWM_001669 [Candidatus Fervidibacterota bacterium]|mgnify:CR=1 FL=1